MGSHVPAGAEREPKVQVWTRDPEGEYPGEHSGVQLVAWGIEAGQLPAKSVKLTSAGRAQGLGSQVPAGAEREPKVQVWAREAEAVYPGEHSGMHVVVCGMEAGQLPTKRVEPVSAGRGHGFGSQTAV